jgi:hypothetical protein
LQENYGYPILLFDSELVLQQWQNGWFRTTRPRAGKAAGEIAQSLLYDFLYRWLKQRMILLQFHDDSFLLKSHSFSTSKRNWNSGVQRVSCRNQATKCQTQPGQ